MAKKLKLKNYTLEEIIELTGLTKEDIDNIQKLEAQKLQDVLYLAVFVLLKENWILD